jgi:hypothetical protein
MGDLIARFGEHFESALLNGSPPLKQERSGPFHGGVTIDSIYYYGKFLYQDVNLRSDFGSIRPPTRLTFGFRLGRCIIIHFPKRTFIHFFSFSKCGFHIVKKGGACYIRNVRNIVNTVKADVVGVANWTVHNLVLEDMELLSSWSSFISSH